MFLGDFSQLTANFNRLERGAASLFLGLKKQGGAAMQVAA
jgi:hypothetical protein